MLKVRMMFYSLHYLLVIVILLPVYSCRVDGLYDGTCKNHCGTCVMIDDSICIDQPGDNKRCWCNHDCSLYGDGDCCGDITEQCGFKCKGPNCPSISLSLSTSSLISSSNNKEQNYYYFYFYLLLFVLFCIIITIFITYFIYLKNSYYSYNYNKIKINTSIVPNHNYETIAS
jgi:hypothetical protein